MAFRPLARDPDAPHQVVLLQPNSGVHTMLTCNCRLRVRLGPIGATRDAAESGRLYNDSSNHVEPFGVNDRAYRLEGSR